MALYSDLNISFVKNAASGDLSVVTDAEAVKQSVLSLLYTNFYERPFQPPLGSAVQLRLFEPYDSVTEFVLAQDIKKVIELYEPRATVKYVDIYKNRGPNNEMIDEHAILVEVAFVVQNIPQIQTAQLILTRLR